jgi:ribosomal protein S18 acetylase RimI-like enzyme
MPAPTVREARPEDLDAIVDFNARLALESEHKILDRAILARGVVAALADRDRLRYWVAEDESGSVVGQAAITREWSDWRAGWIWWFQSVYVHPDHRGQGTFRALHNEIRSAARADSEVIGLRLYVEVSNDRAQRVYQSLGMKPGGYDVYEEMWIESDGKIETTGD